MRLVFIAGYFLNCSFKSRMKWAGHMVRMKDERLTRRWQNASKTTAKTDDCAKRDLRKAEEEEKCRENANSREHWGKKQK